MKELFVTYSWMFEHTDLSCRQIAKIAGFTQARQWDFFDLFARQGLCLGRGNSAEALGVMVLADAERLGMPIDKVATLMGDLVRQGITYLACDSAEWRVVNPEENGGKFVSWFDDGGAASSELRIQDGFGIFGRISKRYLVQSGDKTPVTTNNLDEILCGGQASAFKIIDVLGLVGKLKTACPAALFTARLQ